MLKDYKKITITISMIGILLLMMLTTYATLSRVSPSSLSTNILKIDEEVYGENVFDSSNLKFMPILDNEVSNTNNNIIYIDFKVGGNENNTEESIIYDIALVDLEVDCNLLSPYLKWNLIKNGDLIAEGSLDYKFDTINNGRLVLTPIQQDLKEYSLDKNTYDYYEFYLWISDSLQDESLANYDGEDSQNELIGKKIKGKIEVELYGPGKKALVRNPSEKLNADTCMIESIENNEKSIGSD